MRNILFFIIVIFCLIQVNGNFIQKEGFLKKLSYNIYTRRVSTISWYLVHYNRDVF